MATFYFNGAVDGDWQTLGNWWMDDAFTTQATSLPTSADDVIATSSITSNSGGVPNVVNLTFSDPNSISPYLGISVTVTGNATFNDSSYKNGTVTGNATFNDSSYNYDTVIGNATFNDSSHNPDIVTGNATFNGSSHNNGSVIGNATFNGSSYNNSNVGDDATFNDDSYNNGNINGNATFNDDSHNNGSANGNATFNDDSHNIGVVYGVARFNRFTAVGGAVTDTVGRGTGYVEGGIQDSQGNPVTLWRMIWGLNFGRIVCDAEFIGTGGCYFGTCDGSVTFLDESHCNDIYCSAVPVFRGQSTCAVSWSGGIAVNNNGQGAYFEESSKVGVLTGFSGVMPRNRTTYPIQRGINGSSILGVI